MDNHPNHNSAYYRQFGNMFSSPCSLVLAAQGILSLWLVVACGSLWNVSVKLVSYAHFSIFVEKRNVCFYDFTYRIVVSDNTFSNSTFL